MDVWPPPQDSRKRNFADMSQGATLSPSPIHFGERNSNFLNSPHYLPASNNNSQSSRASPFFERRRTSHPHNQPLQRLSEAMSARSQSVVRRQPSVIDLTDDADDRPVAPRIRQRSHSHRPPQLGRSDAVAFADFIDLTDDNEPDLIITGVQARRRPVPPPRLESPSLFLPEPPQGPSRAAPWGGRVIGNAPNYLDPIRGMGALLGVAQDYFDHQMRQFRVDPVDQAMPRMDYRVNAHAAPRKPEHIPPPEPKRGFTRSPLVHDVIICPSCEEEMIHKKDEEPVMKKGGKAPTKKEREEHPFWVVKECGHVYCNHCFQNRMTATKGSSTVTFPEITRPVSNKGRATKVLGCAVEDCESDVKSKDKWIGVFL